MTNLYDQTELEDLAREVGFIPRNAKIAAAIAMCEAPFMCDGIAHADFDAVGDQNLATDIWGYSYGAWQIRSLRSDKGTGRTRDELRLPNPLMNARAARTIKLAQGWNAWTTFSSGRYKAYMQDVFPPPPNSYIVVSGDTLSKVAMKHGVKWTWQEWAKTNGIQSPYTLQIGQILLMPTSLGHGA